MTTPNESGSPAMASEPTCEHTRAFSANGGRIQCLDCRSEWLTQAEWERARNSASAASGEPSDADAGYRSPNGSRAFLASLRKSGEPSDGPCHACGSANVARRAAQHEGQWDGGPTVRYTATSIVCEECGAEWYAGGMMDAATLELLKATTAALRSQAEAGARELMATQKERTALAKQLGAERAAAAVPRSGGSAQ